MARSGSEVETPQHTFGISSSPALWLGEGMEKTRIRVKRMGSKRKWQWLPLPGVSVSLFGEL